MKKFLCLISFLLAFPVFAEVNIDEKNHILNKPPGLCGWCSIETLGMTHGYDNLKGLTEEKDKEKDKDKKIANISSMIDLLEEKEIYCSVVFSATDEEYFEIREQEKDRTVLRKMFKNQKDADALLMTKADTPWYYIKKTHRNTEDIRKACKDDLGAIVIIRIPDKKANHSVVLININDEKVRFVDSNSKKGVVREETFEWFMERWIGISFVIEKKKD